MPVRFDTTNLRRENQSQDGMAWDEVGERERTEINAINYLSATLERMWPELKFHKLEHTTKQKPLMPLAIFGRNSRLSPSPWEVQQFNSRSSTWSPLCHGEQVSPWRKHMPLGSEVSHRLGTPWSGPRKGWAWDYPVDCQLTTPPRTQKPKTQSAGHTLIGTPYV